MADDDGAAAAVQGLKQLANLAFVQKRFSDADQLYTDAIHSCEEHRHADGIHLLYSNR